MHTQNGKFSGSGLKAGFSIFLGLILLLGITPGCKAKPQAPADSSKTAGADQLAGVPLEIFNKADLHILWRVGQLPMGKTGRIECMFYHNGRLFIVDSSNKLTAMDGRLGTIAWTATLADEKPICSQVEYYQDRMLFVLGQEVVEVKESNGEITRRVVVDFQPVTTAVRTEDKLFLGGGDKRFYAIRLKDEVAVWESVHPEPPTGKIALGDNKVFFGTRDGRLYVSQTEQRSLAWQVSSRGLIPGVMVDGGQCFLPSWDTALYSLNPQNGQLQWKYLAGGVLDTMPVLTENLLYQPVRQKSLLCLERRPADPRGKLRWELPEGAGMLAENGIYSYAMTMQQEMAMMNNETGQRMLSFYVPRMNMFAQNSESALIFLANRSGGLIALEPNTIYPKMQKPAEKPAAPAPAAENGAPANEEKPAEGSENAAASQENAAEE